MSGSVWMVLIGVAVALIGGYYVARQSARFQPVKGGTLAEAFHYLASAGMAGIPAALLVALVVTIFAGENLLGDFVRYAVVTLVVVVVSLLAYAAVEPDAAPQQS